MVFIAIGGDAWVIRGLARTYDVVGLAASYPSLGHIVAGAGARVRPRSSPARSRSPGRCCWRCTLTDAAFGVVSRVVPERSTSSRSACRPRSSSGSLLIGATMPFVAGWLARPAAGRRRHRPRHAEGGVTPMAGDKTEKATPKRREEARKKGQVAKSADLNGAVVDARRRSSRSASTGPAMVARAWPTACATALAAGAGRDPVTIGDRRRHVAATRRATVALCLAPVVGACAARRRSSSTVAQVGIKPTTQALKPRLQAAEPAAGAQEHLRQATRSSSWSRTCVKVGVVGVASCSARCCRSIDRAAPRWSACRRSSSALAHRRDRQVDRAARRARLPRHRHRRLRLPALPPREVAADGQAGGQGGGQEPGRCPPRSAARSAAASARPPAPA